jgi:hypothetical protein
MKKALQRVGTLLWIWLLVSVFILPAPVRAQNQVMGEIQFEGKSHVEETSGVWIDGQYVGYLKELKGSKQVFLLPGEHVITVRQDGYRDFTERMLVQPGEAEVVNVAMEKAPTGVLPEELATVKIVVNPSRAAVFVDGLFVGHVGEFEGLGRAMLVAPGAHRIKIALPGFQTFETDIDPVAKQKVEIKTDLTQSSAPLTGPLVKTESGSATPPSVGHDAGAAPSQR